MSWSMVVGMTISMEGLVLTFSRVVAGRTCSSVAKLVTNLPCICEVPYYFGVRAQGERRFGDAADWYRVAGQREHVRAQRRQNPGDGYFGGWCGLCCRVHGVEVAHHVLQRFLIGLSATFDRRRVADADAQDKSARVGRAKCRPAALHRGWVAGPDVGYPGAGDDSLGCRQQHRLVGECFLAADASGVQIEL